jgi:hypothetical protein
MKCEATFFVMSVVNLHWQNNVVEITQWVCTICNTGGFHIRLVEMMEIPHECWNGLISSLVEPALLAHDVQST